MPVVTWPERSSALGLKTQARLGSIPPPMHRPTRQHRNLVAKIERKSTRRRTDGKKARRWKKWAEQYKNLCEGESDFASDAAQG